MKYRYNKRNVGLISILFLLYSSFFIIPAYGLGNTSLIAGNKLIYTINIIRTQNWQINGTWENMTDPGPDVGWVQLNESRTRTFKGTLIVDVLGVRSSVADLRVTYDLYEEITNLSQQISNESLFYNLTIGYYDIPINLSIYAGLPPIFTNTSTRTTNNWSDSFEMEVDLRTRAIVDVFKFNASEPLSAAFDTIVAGSTTYTSFWIFPDSAVGDSYYFSHIGMNFELVGDTPYNIPNFYATTGDLTYELESSESYTAPANGLGSMHNAFVAKYEIIPAAPGAGLTVHDDYVLDMESYRNEFRFDADTGVLLEYRRIYKILPYDIIEKPGVPFSETADIYNMDYQMYLTTGSIVNLGLPEFLFIIIIIGAIIGGVLIVYLLVRKKEPNL